MTIGLVGTLHMIRSSFLFKFGNVGSPLFVQVGNVGDGALDRAGAVKVDLDLGEQILQVLQLEVHYSLDHEFLGDFGLASVAQGSQYLHQRISCDVFRV